MKVPNSFVLLRESQEYCIAVLSVSAFFAGYSSCCLMSLPASQPTFSVVSGAWLMWVLDVDLQSCPLLDPPASSSTLFLRQFREQIVWHIVWVQPLPVSIIILKKLLRDQAAFVVSKTSFQFLYCLQESQTVNQGNLPEQLRPNSKNVSWQAIPCLWFPRQTF